MRGLYLNLSNRNDNLPSIHEASVVNSSAVSGRLEAMVRRLGPLTRGLAALSLVAGVAACDDPGPTTPETTTTTTETVIETFRGTLNRNGAVAFPFDVFGAGTATATIQGVLPDTTTLGFTMGTWNGSGCTAVLSNDNAGQNLQLVGTVGSAGTLCLRVYDVGRLTDKITFTVSVSHP